jgi:hypothetical protein
LNKCRAVILFGCGELSQHVVEKQFSSGRFSLLFVIRGKYRQKVSDPGKGIKNSADKP